MGSELPKNLPITAVTPTSPNTTIIINIESTKGTNWYGARFKQPISASGLRLRAIEITLVNINKLPAAQAETIHISMPTYELMASITVQTARCAIPTQSDSLSAIITVSASACIGSFNFLLNSNISAPNATNPANRVGNMLYLTYSAKPIPLAVAR